MSDLSKQPTPPSRLQADMSIAWEALPSLKYLLGRRGENKSDPSPVWSDTQPSVLDAPVASPEPAEPFPGLTVREVNEPDIFKAFFEKPSPPSSGRS